MFRVENADFIADKLAAELLPNQEFREAAKNSIEAIQRRFSAGETRVGGRIEFDVDWVLKAQTSNSSFWPIACADNGDGMSHAELERYMTTLAVQGANRNQSLAGNQGMGLKISGPTRHKEGLLIRSMKQGEGFMVQIGWNGREYGLIELGSNDELIVPVPAENFPKIVRDNGSGTVVTFLGNNAEDNTFAPAGRPRSWLFKYLNQRLHSLPDGIELFVRVPVGDGEEWPKTREEVAERSKQGGRAFNFHQVKGTEAVWTDAADHGGDACRGNVSLPGNARLGIAPANLHWWVLPEEGSDVSTRTASGGSIAVLFQDELHDWRTSSHANPIFARLGVVFGKSRVAFVLEPQAATATSDFARAHVLVGGTPVFESDAWPVWADQFREQIPDKIKAAILEEQERIQEEDPDRERRIRERLSDVMSLLRPKRLRRSVNGSVGAAGPSVTGPEGEGNEFAERPAGEGRRRVGAGARGIGSLLTRIDEQGGEPSREVFANSQLRGSWVTEAAADNATIVKGDGRGLRDRAAALVGENAATASTLLLNKDFRGFLAIVKAVNDWANSDGDDAKAAFIQATTQEWIEQKMIEAVIGLRQLENGSSWTPAQFDDALSPIALTAAFMADRYHTLREVKRQAGGLRAASAARDRQQSAQ